ncbi:MAG: hypothetical protein ABW134_17095 [Candidatus Thiodiazotropha endolucinida]
MAWRIDSIVSMAMVSVCFTSKVTSLLGYLVAKRKNMGLQAMWRYWFQAFTSPFGDELFDWWRLFWRAVGWG